MSDIVHRCWAMVSDGARPIDWLVVVIDFLVLIAILYFEGIAEWRHWKERKRKSQISGIVAILSDFIDKGQKLLLDTPHRVSGGAGSSSKSTDNYPDYGRDANTWMTAVAEWTEKTKRFLDDHSPLASGVFSLAAKDAHISESDPIIERYQRLLARLNNLRGIMEKSEVYF